MSSAIERAARIAKDIATETNLDQIPLPVERPWPVIEQAAFQGFAGEIVRELAPETEADPVGVLATLLVSHGSACGPGPYFPVGATYHRATLFANLVGKSSRARKGTSGDLCEALFAHADPEWVSGHRISGISTGEGVGWMCRDDDGDTAQRPDAGGKKPNYSKMDKTLGDRPKFVDDKRLFIDEPEFGQVLQNASRQGNNLSQIIRKLWDGKPLEFVTKATPFKASGIHGSIVAHVTLHELQHLLGKTETTNGFCNRFIWLCVKRSQLLPFGGDMEKLPKFGKRLAQGLAESKRVRKMQFSETARERWKAAYTGELAEELSGTVGDVTSRAEAQTLRLAMCYALVGESDVIEIDHLEAALALWRYARDSAVYVFGCGKTDLTGKILALLQNAGEGGLTRSAISDGLNRNYPGTKVVEALAALKQRGQAIVVKRTDTGGRPLETWRIKDE